MESVLKFLKTVNNTANSMENAHHASKTSSWQRENVFHQTMERKLLTLIAELSLKTENVHHAENTTPFQMENVFQQAPIQNVIYGISKKNANAVTTTKYTIWTTITSAKKRTKTAPSSTHKMDGVPYAWMGQLQRMENVHLLLRQVEQIGNHLIFFRFHTSLIYQNVLWL